MTYPSELNLSPAKAVLFGHLFVNVPVLAIMGFGFLLGYLDKGLVTADVCLLVSVLPAWLWWSITVPRWREWTKRKGAEEYRTQILAERTGLVWPKGSFLERTEIRPRKRG
jgi:hypothetical protein